MSADWYEVKPADVEAIQWDPTNLDATLAQLDEWDVDYTLDLKRSRRVVDSAELSIATANGWAYPSAGDWIVREADEAYARRVTAAEFANKYKPKGTTAP